VKANRMLRLGSNFDSSDVFIVLERARPLALDMVLLPRIGGRDNRLAAKPCT
jgi:hypothetical protein